MGDLSYHVPSSSSMSQLPSVSSYRPIQQGGLQNYRSLCHACFDQGCGFCAPPAKHKHYIGAASCVKDASFCSTAYMKAGDDGAHQVCNVTIIPFAAVIAVLVLCVLCCAGCLGYCGLSLRRYWVVRQVLESKRKEQGYGEREEEKEEMKEGSRESHAYLTGGEHKSIFNSNVVSHSSHSMPAQLSAEKVMQRNV